MSGDLENWEEYKEENFPVNDVEKASSELARMAENWQESISDERAREKLMISYIVGVTDDVTRREARKMLEENDVIG